MCDLLQEADKLSTSTAPLLITGETGTGKELIARRAHGARGSLIVIDCTNLNCEIAERELFGNLRGAYTGAVADKPGLIQEAHGGTAFLQIQAKLLRLLQSKTYRPVGSTVERHSDFRVIAATNRDLKAEVSHGRFREDLYYRLNVARLKVPALRERPTDIPLLVSYFAARDKVSFSPEALNVIMNYPWPGNVRQLQNFVARVAAKGLGRCVNEADLPSTIYQARHRGSLMRLAAAVSAGGPANPFPPLLQPDDNRPAEGRGTKSLSHAYDWQDIPPLTMGEIESLAILRALHTAKGDRTRAAVLLGIGRTTLYRKIREIESDSQVRDQIAILSAAPDLG
jgi:two-component system response regulator AtoC